MSFGSAPASSWLSGGAQSHDGERDALVDVLLFTNSVHSTRTYCSACVCVRGGGATHVERWRFPASSCCQADDNGATDDDTLTGGDDAGSMAGALSWCSEDATLTHSV